MNYPINIEQKLAFDQVRASVLQKCLTESGKTEINKLKFLVDYKKIEKELSIVDEMREIIVLDYNFPLSYFDDLSKIFEKLEIEDAVIELSEIVSLKKFLDVLRSVLRFFEDERNQKFKHLAELSSKPIIHKYVSDQINGVINSKGTVKDNASPELFGIRKTIRVKQNEVSKKLNAVYSRIKQSGWLSADISTTIVNGRLVVPIDSNHKRKITGMVHDVSATGKTSYIEPSEVLNLNNEIVDLEYQERQEIERIIKQVCDNIRPYIYDLKQAFYFLSLIDMYRAKAKYAVDINAIKPAVYPEAQINLVRARHPLLYLTLRKENKDIVPLNIRFNENDRIALISGPNAGGKSVALKTVGILQLMLQYGFLLPVGGATEMGVFNDVFIDMGDEQSMDNDLSTYSSHLMNMKHFLKNCNNKTLILIDEFGTGTEPKLGGAIAESVLEQLNKTGTFGVITTHYSNLKHLAASKKGLVNAAMMFDNQKMQPLFQLELSQAGSSFAFEIARKIGLPEEVLKSASAKVGKEQVDFDKHLREVLRDKKYWNEKRYKIRQEEKQIDSLVNELSKNMDDIKAIKRRTISDAKKEASELLNSVNKKVEKTIRDIRNSQAEKEKTKAIRQEFETFRQEIISQKEKEQESVILKKIELLKKRRDKKEEQRKEQKQNQNKPSKTNNIQKINEVEHNDFVVGSFIKVKSTETYGEILKISGKKAQISIGSMQMNIAIGKLELVGRKEYKRKAPPIKKSSTVLFTNSSEKKLLFSAHVDLRGLRVDEAIQKLTRFIDDAITTNSSELKILHGTGTGALKIAVREYLNTINLVKSFKDEQLELGGAGITVVKMV